MKMSRRLIGAVVMGSVLLPGIPGFSWLPEAGSGHAAFAQGANDRIDYVKSVVSVSAAKVKGDGNVTIKLTVKNKHGDQLGGGNAVSFFPRGGTSGGILSAVTDHHDGTYTANFRATLTGTPLTIYAAIDGEMVRSDLPTIEVLPRDQVITSSGTTTGDSTPMIDPPYTGTTGGTTTGGSTTGGTTTSGTTTGGTTTGGTTGGSTTTSETTAGSTTGGTTSGGTTTGGTTTGGSTTGTTTGGTTTGGTTTGGTTTGGTTTGGSTTGGTTTGGTTTGGTATGGTTTGGTTTLGEVILVPGTGFTGPTAEPGPVAGTAKIGAGAKAIARWDTVPHQDFASSINVAVVAFHINEIDRVEFSANGGPWAAVREMTVNAETGVREYWAKLRAADFGGGGAVEVRAIAYPKCGLPRLLDSMWLNANPGNALPALVMYVSPSGSDTTGDGSQGRPFQTLSKASKAIANKQGGKGDGGTVYLQPGSYQLSSASGVVTNANRWLTLTPAPGVAKGQAVITGSVSSAGLCVRLLRLANLTIHPPTTTTTDATTGVTTTTTASQIIRANSSVTDSKIWLDGVDCIGPGRLAAAKANMQWVTPAANGGFGQRYFTRCYTRDSADGLTQATLNRGSTSEWIAADHWQNSVCVINCTARNTDKTGTSSHPDVIQYTGTYFENVVLYGNTSTENAISQGYFICGATQNGVAIVGNKAAIPSNYWLFKTSSANHMLVRGNTFTGGLSGSVGPKWDAGPFSDVAVDEVSSQFPQATSIPTTPPTGVSYRTFSAAFD